MLNWCRDINTSWSLRPWDAFCFFCGSPVWLQWNVRCISRTLASPLQGEPSPGLMQYGYPLPQAETGVMVSRYWSLVPFCCCCCCCAFSSLFRHCFIVRLHPVSRWNWQRLILFVFLCLSGLRPERCCSVFPVEKKIEKTHLWKTTHKVSLWNWLLPRWYVLRSCLTSWGLRVCGLGRKPDASANIVK